MQRMTVNIPGRGSRYEFLVKPGALRDLGTYVREVAPHGTAMLAVDERIADSHGAVARDSLVSAEYHLQTHTLAADERHKTLDTVRAMYDAMLAAGMERGSPVIALGGGVIGDVAGFAAATYMRGVPLVQVPTTLLAMVDAAIGGKTGVNLPLPSGSLGKNLIGAFWQPRVVVADPDTLLTLDDRELRCGLAECIKHGVIADRSLLSFIYDNLPAIMQREAKTLTELVARSAAVKVAIVQADEREAGLRALLNLGHTFGHVIEPLPELNLKHGEAVAIGLCAAGHTAVLTGRLNLSQADEIERVISIVGLPTRLPTPVESGPLIAAMAYDKKVAGGRVRLVLPTSDGSAELVDDAPRDAVAAAWAHVGAIDA
jgi:3-dehydroquinate synthase